MGKQKRLGKIQRMQNYGNNSKKVKKKRKKSNDAKKQKL